eukprot:g5492.t1
MESTKTEEESSSFGFQQVNAKDKPAMVGEVFKSVASRYDLMNDLMSCGLHRIWKDHFVSKITVFPEMHHLDVAGGTGDIAFRVMDKCSVSGLTSPRVIVSDLSPEMIKVGTERVERSGKEIYKKQMDWVVSDAENLPFIDNAFDSYSIAFGIRNCTHMELVLNEAYRVLKQGGCFHCLEFSRVDNSFIRSFYDFYSFNVIPWIGGAVTGDRRSYQYLVESIRNFPTQVEFADEIERTGFKTVRYENLMGGIVAIHTGIKLA